MPVINRIAPVIPTAGVIMGVNGNGLVAALVASIVIRIAFDVFCKDLLLLGEANELSVVVGPKFPVGDRASCVTVETAKSVPEGEVLLGGSDWSDELEIAELLEVVVGIDELGEPLVLVDSRVAAEVDETPLCCRIRSSCLARAA